MQKKALLAQLVASRAQFTSWENGTCPYIPTYMLKKPKVCAT